MAPPITEVRRGHARSGSTLIEVMVAALILAALAIAGAAVLHQARAGHYAQATRRVALELATGRLEDLRASPFAQVKPPVKNFDAWYISRDGGSWTHGTSDPGETVTVNNRTMELTTTVRYADLDAGQSNSYDYVIAEVAVAAGDRDGNWMRLDTRISP